VPPTKLTVEEIFHIICQALSECSLLVQDENGDYQPCDSVAA